MSKKGKLLARLLSLPKNFTWVELNTTLSMFGYTEIKKGKTSGSRRRFSDEFNNIIALHKPHPGNIVKVYALREVIAHLKEKGYIQDE